MCSCSWCVLVGVYARWREQQQRRQRRRRQKGRTIWTRLNPQTAGAAASPSLGPTHNLRPEDLQPGPHQTSPHHSRPAPPQCRRSIPDQQDFRMTIDDWSVDVMPIYIIDRKFPDTSGELTRSLSVRVRLWAACLCVCWDTFVFSVCVSTHRADTQKSALINRSWRTFATGLT